LAALVAILVASPWAGQRTLRLTAFDAYQWSLPRARISEPAVIVDIDEASLVRHGQWPWPRTRLAQLVGAIAEHDPAAIGVVILMPEPDRLSPPLLPELLTGLGADLADRLRRLESHDTAFAGALRGRPVVLGMAGVYSADAPDASSFHQVPIRLSGADPIPFIRRFDGGLRTIQEVAIAAAGEGLLNLESEDGVLRRLPLVASVGATLVPGLGIEMLRVARGALPLTVRTGRGGIEAVGVGDLMVPTEPDGSVWMRYGRHDPARFVSAADVLTGRVATGRFERKLVLIGVNAVGLSDYQSTPVGDRMAGVEIHAQLLENIFDGTLLSRPAWAGWTEAAVLALGGLALVLTVPMLPFRWSIPLLLALVAATVASGVLLYLQLRILFDFASPALGLGMIYTPMLGLTLADIESQRRALRGQLDHEREAAARLAGELEAARRIQMGILPNPLEAFPAEDRFRLAALLEPAREVGGDFYDFFRLGDRHLCFLIGDISGKGLPGSLFMALSKSLCKSIALRGDGDAGHILTEADTEISRDNREALFVTAFLGVLDVETGRLGWCNAGHEPPYLLPRPDRPLTALGGASGPPLCVVDGFRYSAATHQLCPGDILCLVTDGVTEAMSASGELYGRRRLEAALQHLEPAVGPNETARALQQDVARFAMGVEPADDLTILVLQWSGPIPVHGPEQTRARPTP
jgi:CHASE2 domain-containing sensor protein